MPTYEYRCRVCEHRFERFQKMSDPPVRECPSCGAAKAERLISSGGGFLFKGPGFYATDYRKPDPRRSSDASASDAKEKSGSEKPKTGDKPGGSGGAKGEGDGA